MFGCAKVPWLFCCGLILCTLSSCNSTEKPLKIEKVAADKATAQTKVRPPKGALSLAVAEGDSVQTIALLKNGADINENIGKEGEIITPLLVSIALANSPITQILLQNGADQSITYRNYASQELAHFQLLTREVLNSFEVRQ